MLLVIVIVYCNCDFVLQCCTRFRFRLLESCGDNDELALHADPTRAVTVNLLIAGLVNMVGLRSHNRLLYSGLLCLANIGQDAVRSVHM